MGIPVLKIRQSRDRLIFNMGIPILVRRQLYNEMGPRLPYDFTRPEKIKLDGIFFVSYVNNAGSTKEQMFFVEAAVC